MKNIRIAIIEPVGGYGGMDIYDISILDGLSRYCSCVHLYTSKYFKNLKCNPVEDIKMVFGEIYSKDKNIFIRLISSLLGVFSVAKFMVINRYDIKYCHVFTYSPLELAVILAAAFGSGRVYINIHDPQPFINKSNKLTMSIFKMILKIRLFNVVTHSEYSKKTLMENYQGVLPIVMPHTDIDYIYAPPICSQTESKNILGLSGSEKYILFFGQIKKNKGLSMLLEAFAALQNLEISYKLIVAGRCWGEDWSAYQKIIDENKISENVVVVNKYIPPEMVYHYFNSSEFVVLPYTEIFSSGVLIRSMGYGKPVVCSNLPAFLEEIIDRENGVVFEAGSVNSLINALATTICSPMLIESMTEKVVGKYSNKYNRYAVAEKMLKVFGYE